MTSLAASPRSHEMSALPASRPEEAVFIRLKRPQTGKWVLYFFRLNVQ